MGGHATVDLDTPRRTREETDEELRARIIQLTMSSVWHPTENRVIRMLAGLSFTSLINLVNGMSREVCLDILAGQDGLEKAVLPGSLGHRIPDDTATLNFSRIQTTPTP